MKRQPGRIKRYRHIRQHPLQSLKLCYRTPELLTLLHEGHRPLKRTLGNTKSDRAGADSLAVVGVYEIRKPAAKAAWRQHEHVLVNCKILEDHLGFRDAAKSHRGLPLCDDQAGSAGQSNKPTNPLLLTSLVKCPSEYQMQFGDPAARNPMLFAVDHVGVAAPVGPGGHLGCGRSGVGFSDADRRLVP